MAEPALEFQNGDILIKYQGAQLLFDDLTKDMVCRHRWHVLGVKANGEDILEGLVEVDVDGDPARVLADQLHDFLNEWFLGPQQENKNEDTAT